MSGVTSATSSPFANPAYLLQSMQSGQLGALLSSPGMTAGATSSLAQFASIVSISQTAQNMATSADLPSNASPNSAANLASNPALLKATLLGSEVDSLLGTSSASSPSFSDLAGGSSSIYANPAQTYAEALGSQDTSLLGGTNLLA